MVADGADKRGQGSAPDEAQRGLGAKFERTFAVRAIQLSNPEGFAVPLCLGAILASPLPVGNNQ